MPIETITFKNKEYPKFQAAGGASLWVREFAKQYCIGRGYDIGFSKPEWQFPGSVGIDENLGQAQNAMNLMDGNMDYIHSSHCLEHVNENWHNVLDYWLTKIKVGGVIFLYLPHKSQEYWLPENNRKHIHSFIGKEIADYLRSLGHKVMRSGVDLNHSFVVVCEKIRTTEKADWIKAFQNHYSDLSNMPKINYGKSPLADYLEEKTTISDEQLADIKKKWGELGNNPNPIIVGYDANATDKLNDKSIAGVFHENNAILKNHTNNWPNDNITDFTNKIKEDRLKSDKMPMWDDIRLDTHERITDFLNSPTFQNLSLNKKREILGYKPL